MNSYIDVARQLVRRACQRIEPGNTVKPADFAVYAWVLAVMHTNSSLVVRATASQIHLGIPSHDTIVIAGVGLSLNTIKASLETLEKEGWLIIERTPSTKGEQLRIELP